MSANEVSIVRRDRLAGGLLGLLIGDAVGVPYEFNSPEKLPGFDSIDLVPPAGFRRSHPSVLPGTWSDDGAQALCLLACLLQHGKLHIDDFSRRLVNWARYGYLAVDGDVFDIGIQTSRAIVAIESGVPAQRSGPDGEFDNGNGSLMRVMPLALWHRGSDAELIELAALQSLPTHGHVRSQVSCAIACLWARAELIGNAASWKWAEETLRRLGPAVGLPEAEIKLVLDPANAQKVKGSGYVVDTLWSARHALDTQHDYASSVRAAIALGNDTDTTAAVAGSIAGIRYSCNSIPLAWREALRGKNLLSPLLDALLQVSDDHHV